ncbi:MULTISPECIES: PaaI family thioesterase [Thiorhodovibrio]|uniref:PaaI family thioesterase n=1 Tax=Thiorhodovibrio TaxID=61593 RepID=UPI001912F6DD|nr:MULTISPECIES: PaaI family thioesterase [Thiorhodovibrio]MBK5969725.1 phenylacetic acid degradation protein [Thiorhodovibrio winogradskyi]WPL13774.1 Acyl-coenzyme A thioesterase PaaI [Thiorhodovibrio litoralis]
MDESLVRKYFSGDRFAEYLGIELLEVSPGRARAKLAIDERHLNGVGIVHGGAIFALADLAFAVASNSHGQIALGINVSIAYHKGVSSGTLYADAEETAFNPKLATYQIRISNEQDDTLASFQGTVYRKRETLDQIVHSSAHQAQN